MIHGIFHIKKGMLYKLSKFYYRFSQFFLQNFPPPLYHPPPHFSWGFLGPPPVPSTWGLPRANNWCLGDIFIGKKNNFGLGKEHSNYTRIGYSIFQIVWLDCFFLSSTSCSMRKCNVSASPQPLRSQPPGTEMWFFGGMREYPKYFYCPKKFETIF